MKSRAKRTHVDPRKNLVGFVVGPAQYAIGVTRVRQIINPLPVTPLPHMPHGVVGVAEHRGEIVPVVDLRRYYGLPAQHDRRTKWVLITSDQDLTVGVVVDAVVGVFRASDDQMRPSPALAEAQTRRGITGVASNDGALVFVTNPDLFAEIVQPLVDKGLPAATDPHELQPPETK